MKARLIVVTAMLALVTTASLARAEVVQRGNLRVTFEGEISPHALPRSSPAPVRVSVGTKIASLKAGSLPRLRTITIAINRYGKFDPKLLPACTLRDIQPATTENALEALRRLAGRRGDLRGQSADLPPGAVSLGRQALRLQRGG